MIEDQIVSVSFSGKAIKNYINHNIILKPVKSKILPAIGMMGALFAYGSCTSCRKSGDNLSQQEARQSSLADWKKLDGQFVEMMMLKTKHDEMNVEYKDRMLGCSNQPLTDYCKDIVQSLEKELKITDDLLQKLKNSYISKLEHCDADFDQYLRMKKNYETLFSSKKQQGDKIQDDAESRRLYFSVLP